MEYFCRDIIIKTQNYGLFPISEDIKQSTYVFLIVFCIYPVFIEGNKYIPICFRMIEKTSAQAFLEYLSGMDNFICKKIKTFIMLAPADFLDPF